MTTDDTYRLKQEALRLLLPAIPHGTNWQAHRYDTDDSMVLVLWRGDGETIQFDCAKVATAPAALVGGTRGQEHPK